MQGKAPADRAHARTNPAAEIGIARASRLGTRSPTPASTQHRASECPTVRGRHQEAGRRPAPTLRRVSENPRLFDKQTGKVGSIAEALAKTTLHLSETDRLTKTQAYRILGMLMTGEG
ncbi:MAG: hypothetical protein JSS47_12175 [Proteobacteria bacterium]|nr:hypothetical protein [Pseudomonadota bacterium]